ncbi:MAG: recombinase family protein [Thermoplasmata archaeon]|nr:recombinase family protein [Thermoplasmata archaeon]
MPTCDLYLRLSDARIEEALDGREVKLRGKADDLGWIINRVVVENDAARRVDGKLRPASAFKRRIVRDRDGAPVLDPDTGRPITRVIRPGWQSVIADLKTGRASAVLAEDLDRVCRDPRDLEDLIDACEARRASARSLSGSLTLTDGGTDGEITFARMMVTMANKSSRDTRRRVTEKNETLNGNSYRGGPRPFGYVPAHDTEKYHRNLLVVPDEAEVLRQAADDILRRGISLQAIVRDLRERGVPTVSGASWKPAILRNALLKPTVAGLALHRGVLKDAPWPAILDRDVWERLKAKLEDPERCTNTGNEPKWLLSGIAKCGVCADGTTVRTSGSDLHNSGPGYTCTSGKRHMRRSTRYADALVAGLIVARLEMDDARDLLRPPPRPAGVDAPELRAEAKKLRARKASQMKMHAAGDIDDADLAAGMREIRDRLAVIDAQLAASDEPDPLAEFRDRPAQAVWESRTIARKRTIVRLLLDVTMMPTTRRGPGFDPDSVLTEWRA